MVKNLLLLSKNKNWVKIKTSYDNILATIKNDKFIKNLKPTHKIFRLKSQVFKKLNNKFVTTNQFYTLHQEYLQNKNKNFIEFDKNQWLKKKI